MKKIIYVTIGLCILVCYGFISYPIDGYERTGIKRLYQIRQLQLDSVKYNRIPAGAYKMLDEIKLNLTDRLEDSINDLLVDNAEFMSQLKRLIPGGAYSVAVMDMTDPKNLKYASHRENVGYQPGSVGKIAVLNAVFTQMAKVCPNSFQDRIDYLKGIRVSSRYWGTGDHHTVPVYDMEKDKLAKRQVRADDTFSLFEWLDHMISVSNNGAASVMYREAMLMAAFKENYVNLTEEDGERYFKETPRDSLTNLAHMVVNEPLRDLGITEDDWRLGGMFTRPAGKYVGRKGGSIGTPRGLMKFLVKLEQGKVVDKESSLEMKRLLYLTDRRIRYARSTKLDSAAVYFKSGSYYKCDRDKNPDCRDYAGNVFNYMNSVIIVEHPNGIKYIVCLMSNVLNKNSAGAHMYMASKIDNLITKNNDDNVILNENYKDTEDQGDGN